MKITPIASRHLRDVLIAIWALVPPLAWAIQFEAVYALTPPDRRPEHLGALRAVSLVALAAAAAATWQAYAELVRAQREARPFERRRRPVLWLASAAVGTGLFFCLVIITTGLVTWFVSPQN
jgi:hypothetical protein